MGHKQINIRSFGEIGQALKILEREISSIMQILGHVGVLKLYVFWLLLRYILTLDNKSYSGNRYINALKYNIVLIN